MLLLLQEEAEQEFVRTTSLVSLFMKGIHKPCDRSESGSCTCTCTTLLSLYRSTAVDANAAAAPWEVGFQFRGGAVERPAFSLVMSLSMA
jgi:hypothetical protein